MDPPLFLVRLLIRGRVARYSCSQDTQDSSIRAQSSKGSAPNRSQSCRDVHPKRRHYPGPVLCPYQLHRRVLEPELAPIGLYGTLYEQMSIIISTIRNPGADPTGSNARIYSSDASISAYVWNQGIEILSSHTSAHQQ